MGNCRHGFGLLPGHYKLRIDPKQLDFMRAVSDPEVIEFEVRALADGDYHENLNFVLRTLAVEEK